MSTRPPLDHLVAIPARRPGGRVVDLAGSDLDGRPRTVEVSRADRWTLLLFLGPHCDACVPFWSAASNPQVLGLATGDDVVTIVRDDADRGAVCALLDGMPGAQRPIVLPRAAWYGYGIQGPPAFVLADGARVATEGVAWSVGQVAADVGRARGA